ncbi:MAG: aminodeoxychorismate synthase component I [Pseudomonadota bacterium]|nr:aminodeoxychorismate synthase component I [Pseudomonadota bacterium]
MVETHIMVSGAIAEALPWVDPLAYFSAVAETPYAIWLDTADTRHPAGRYSFIMHDPFETLTLKNPHDNPFAQLKTKLAQWQEDWAGLEAHWPDSPPFKGGAAGLFGYDLVQSLEKLPRHLPPYAVDDTRLPDMAVGFYDLVLGFDHQTHRCFVFSTGFPSQGAAERSNIARLKIENLKKTLHGLPKVPAAHFPASCKMDGYINADIEASIFKSRVQKVIDYIHAGDIFQANLSHRFSGHIASDDTPLTYYARLRHISPGPFAGYANFGNWVLASASPERFLECKHQRVETRPIKGTRPRSGDPKTDMALLEDLKTSQKDRAENVMIVDLLRNDLSRVCEDGSMKVSALCELETFETVHHLVSIISGQLRSGMSPPDLLEACFPGGSISGAPKIRAMEIIAELENNTRGPYTGALGYIGFDGAMDMNILIRTAVIRDKKITFQVGGGIVADSQPEAEYLETLDKARGLITAIGVEIKTRDVEKISS